MNLQKLGLKKYFWDTDVKNIDKKEHAPYIIQRILEYGDMRAIRWLLSNFKKELIRQILRERRGFSPQTLNFWSLILCLKKHYPKKQKTLWPY